MESPPNVVSAIQMLGKGMHPQKRWLMVVKPSCAACSVPKEPSFLEPVASDGISSKKMKPEQGVDRLPPTQGAWKQHILRAHLQARIWAQDLVEKPNIPDPLTLGWKKEGDRLIPVLSSEAAAPDCVLELVKCGCGANNPAAPMKCTKRCSCKKHNLACTELCQCGQEDGVCANRSSPLPEDDEDEEELY
ncbi:hypothetical protein GWK47_044959 [Chionoecetes opilio]|uniref:Tesmin/TSO1-like CXC domain-containing protein n=1 Tax=Chionoecetes opilio TaxID=41210 RepID=A0A8J4YDE9_CHIOP|nr:hypothetical protein GWK47_044959 [Chionoecetes opilio]